MDVKENRQHPSLDPFLGGIIPVSIDEITSPLSRQKDPLGINTFTSELKTICRIAAQVICNKM